MDEVATYLVFSAAIGLMQVWDNYKLYIQAGESLRFDWAFSFIEFVWVFVSVAVLVAIDMSNRGKVVPVVYISFNVLFWLYSVRLYSESERSGDNEITVPLWSFQAGMVFGIGFCILCSAILFMQYADHPGLTFINIYVLRDALIAIFAVLILIAIGIKLFKSYSVRLFEKQILEAIQSTPECGKHLGKISRIVMDSELTAAYEGKVFAYLVYGDKNKGTVLALFESYGPDAEKLVHGFLELESGEVVELGEPAFAM
jgi:hypothetical protein